MEEPGGGDAEEPNINGLHRTMTYNAFSVFDVKLNCYDSMFSTASFESK